MKKKKVDYLCYEVCFWYVKILDLADFKYLIIYPLASFFLEKWLFKTLKNNQKMRFRPNLEDCIFITKIGISSSFSHLF